MEFSLPKEEEKKKKLDARCTPIRTDIDQD